MANIKIMAMGGLGENGKNMYVVDVNDRLFILDAGIKYPDVDMYGVDSIIANIDFLKDRKDKIEGIFISHGHEDNMGAIPYLLKNLPTRVYGSHFTISLIESVLTENNMPIKKFKLFRINANKTMKFGNVSVTFFNTTHSIPESMGICLSTEDGNIVYCTDFNFCISGSNNYQTTFDKISDIGKNKVLVVLSESINAGSLGRISNDSLLEHNFNSVLSHHHERIYVGAYATDVIRIQKAIDLSVAAGRKVAVVTRKGSRVINVGLQLGYLRIPEENLFDISKYSKEDLEKLKDVVIIITGFRNDPYLTLVKMVEGADELTLTPNDLVVMICPPVPGTEKLTTDAINTLYKYDAHLVIFDKSIIRSAHASPEDLKLLYALLKPKYIMPIKGEYRHIYQQSLAAIEYGYDNDHIIKADNGDCINFINGELQKEIVHYNISDVFIDGTSIGAVDNNVLIERTTLAEEGIIYVYGAVDVKKKSLVGRVSLSTRGFSYSLTEENLTASLGELMERIINNYLKKKTWSLNDAKESVQTELSKVVLRYTKHRPIIVPVIMEL